jgi:hypothetical protein
MTGRRNRAKSSVALVLLAALSVASVCHLWHHITDPDCGTDGRHGSQPCATCAGLHSAVIEARSQPPAQPHQYEAESIPPVMAGIHAAPVVPGGAPRAPPAA